MLATLDGHEKRATAVAFSNDGSRLATVDTERAVRLWLVGDGAVERSWTAERSVGALGFSNRGDRIAGAAYYGRRHFWDLPASRQPRIR